MGSKGLLLICVLFFSAPNSWGDFIRGDVNDDGQIETEDAIYLLEFLFSLVTTSNVIESYFGT